LCCSRTPGSPTDVIWKLGPKGKSTVFHTLVDSDTGSLCHNCWKLTWGATMTLQQLAATLMQALAQPDCKEPTNADAANLLTTNVADFCARAREAAAGCPAAPAAGGGAGGGGGK
jgi:hypothetical protein